MAKIMLTIFEIQDRKISNFFGQIDLTQLYSAPWVKNCSEENPARCRCDSFCSRLCVVTRLRGDPLLFMSSFQILAPATLGERYF
jgi:hypothetical protein